FCYFIYKELIFCIDLCTSAMMILQFIIFIFWLWFCIRIMRDVFHFEKFCWFENRFHCSFFSNSLMFKFLLLKPHGFVVSMTLLSSLRSYIIFCISYHHFLSSFQNKAPRRKRRLMRQPVLVRIFFMSVDVLNFYFLLFL